jgi:5-methyltetrahydrofolate--homocysteine methyltransferase
MNASFLSMAIGAGMTSAITNPLHEPEMHSVMGANVVMGHDPNCKEWIKKFREPLADTDGEGSAGGRRSGRRRRRA